jgi:hypothetical protein
MQSTLDFNRPPTTPLPGIGFEGPRTLASTPDSALAVFRVHGGVAHAEEVVERLRKHCSQPMSRLARWIAGREVLIVESHGEAWLPLFQFDLDVGAIRPEAFQTITTLTPAFDDWELVSWFVEPNSWLDGDAPICVFFHDAPSVLQAARADRFAVAG